MTDPMNAQAVLGPGHRHDASLEDALAFVNTLEFSSGGEREDLATAFDLLGWLRQRGLIHAETEESLSHRLRADDAAAALVLERARSLRTAMREAIEAVAERRPAPRPALDRINEVARQGYAYELVPGPAGVVLDHRHPADDPSGGLASLAAALADGVTAGRPQRLKVCANDQCRWVFNDASHAGRRKWCDMTSCGNAAKARRHRERQRVGGEPGPVKARRPAPAAASRRPVV
jgi:predicted RNA-binding Zn ribbon-like protein